MISYHERQQESSKPRGKQADPRSGKRFGHSKTLVLGAFLVGVRYVIPLCATRDQNS